MSRDRKSKSDQYLAHYQTGDFLLKPNDVAGSPGLMPAQSRDGREVLIKMWTRKSGPAKSDIEEIWRSEIRQLQRLAAVPRADDLLVPMLNSGYDSEGFYLILDSSGGDPLETFRTSTRKPHILAQPQQVRNKRLLWGNALRIAQALELLHSQGIIHRNLDPWAIITSLDEEPDFRLTGFEWSMRLATLGNASSAKSTSLGSEPRLASFSHDWRNLGFLISELIGAPAGRVADMRLLPTEIADHISSSEGSVLRLMLGVGQPERLDGELICMRIEEIISGISSQVAGREAKLALGIRFGTGSQIAETIRRASGAEIETADIASQLDFVKQDLSDQPFLVRLEEANRQTPKYALIGKLLTYSLSPYRQPGSSAAADWEFAQCDRAQYGRPFAPTIGGQETIRAQSLDIQNITDAYKSFPRKRGRVEPWFEAIKSLDPRAEQKTDLDLKHQAFALLTILEMAYAAANIFPVVVHTPKQTGDLAAHILRLSSRFDEGRARLSKALQLQPPAIRLAKMIEADEVSGDNGWVLSESGTLGERNENGDWRYVESRRENDSEVLHFEGRSPTSIRGNAFIVPAGLVGEIAQFKRRVKALRALSDHTELLRMLVDPRLRIEDTQDPLKIDNEYKRMDTSKQSALKEILSTIPLFLLQGPPGVGKTHIVGDLVRRRFADEPATRILLSAQSNAAIDHLMKDVQDVFQNHDNPPVMVRARPADDDDQDTDLEIDKQADNLLQALASSPLVANANDELGKRIEGLARANRGGSRARRGSRGTNAEEVRALEAMILRSANLVFATTNSGAVERLIEEKSLFDWTVIEEAGKATGGELISPLLLSHRRLMIGDHKQLPPYGADKLAALLADPAQVKEAIGAAETFISRYLREPGIEEVFEEVSAENVEYGRACSDALRVLTLFEDMLEAELTRKPGRQTIRPIARRLNEQHRMHPAIATIVSDCFYGGELTTNQEKIDLYRRGVPPFSFAATSPLPNLPLVFIDLPYSRTKINYKGGDRPPAWHNPDEVTAVLKALAALRSQEGKTPSLAVLSPYREQVKRLKQKIDAKLNSSLANLRLFTPALGSDGFCGTVDSFQGDQADLVVVSMVRNNGHATPRKALGFLSDDRRMNVLLSRAKWRLVIVGSLDFYRHVVEFSEALPDSEINFLKKFLVSFERAVGNKDACVIDWSKLAGITV